MQIAEKALFPPAEWKESHWRGDANIDTHITDLGFVTELACSSPAAGEDAGHIPILPAINQGNGLVERIQVHEA